MLFYFDIESEQTAPLKMKGKINEVMIVKKRIPELNKNLFNSDSLSLSKSTINE